MPTPAPIPQVSSKPRPPKLKGFENSPDSQKQEPNELSEILRAAGEQIGGYKPESVNPIPGHDTVDKLKAQDEAYKKSNYPTLKERLRHIAEANKQRVAAGKQQEAQQKTDVAKAKNVAPVVEAKSKGSLRQRMMGAMGIKRKGSTPSSAETSATREYGAKKTQ